MSVDDHIPQDVLDSVKMLHESVKAGEDFSGKFESIFLEIVDKIVLGEKSDAYFSTVARAIGVVPDDINTNTTLANILWLCGTQVGLSFHLFSMRSSCILCYL